MHTRSDASPVTVIADDREPELEVVDRLREIHNVTVHVERLKTGDYIVNQRLLFERKTLPDFARSIVDGRLFKQMMRLANSRYTAVLILEGTARNADLVGVRREALQGALITVSIILSAPVLRSMAPDETARLIVYAARQVQSLGKAGYPKPGYRPRTQHSRRLYILQGLPGIGHEKAARLLDKFGSVEAVMRASREGAAECRRRRPKDRRSHPLGHQRTAGALRRREWICDLTSVLFLNISDSSVCGERNPHSTGKIRA